MRVASLSCVVVAYQRAESLAALLGHLEHPDIEKVIVNVDADADVSRVVRSTSRASEIQVPNEGYAAAVNAGARRAAAELVIFLNDDALMSADTALRLGQRALERGRVVVPALLDHAGVPEHALQPFPSARALLLEWALLPDRPPPWSTGRLVRKWRAPEGPALIEAAAATVVACPAHVLRKVPLPEAYFMYWEDSEWFWRLHQAGIPVEYAPDLPVRHLGGRADVRPEKSSLLARNAVRCVRRTRGSRSAAAAWPVVVLWNLRLCVGDLIRGPFSTAARRRLIPRAAGLIAAIRACREIR